ncbi:ABC transporter permease [Heliophilum fasciatum]|uniref:NitT/TauT family transport system permease protein n=1 Tax=Heliophilum fasciatum TaxID=35700 RepID=A0A4R2S119_9FIRM|nr:ABC transporter permease subunit [Heliophilum fasciatum]MCW2277678.1 NitT/TauT family transport system permease protein [Heliophilum fasciatum]TCP65025.1 NitT/TauT family transport system permease protein [Heliophilum fasciatum]
MALSQPAPTGISEVQKKPFPIKNIVTSLLPLLLLALFWAEHTLLPDGQMFTKRRYLAESFPFLMGLYLVTFGASFYRKDFHEKLTYQAPLIAGVIGFLMLWDVVTLKLGLLPLPQFPSPGAVIAALIADAEVLFVSIYHSLGLLFGGYLLGLLFGIPTGILMGWFSSVNYWLSPILRFIGPIPATAWIPIAMVVFPSSFQASIFLVALAAWFPITIMTWSGISNVSNSYYEVARTLGASTRYLILKVALPASLPSVFVGTFMGLGSSFATLVVAELLGVKAGMGWYVSWAQGWAEYAKVWAALFVMAIIFSGTTSLLFKVRDRVLVWQKGLVKW